MQSVKEKILISVIILIFGILCAQLPERIEKLKGYMSLKNYFTEKSI